MFKQENCENEIMQSMMNKLEKTASVDNNVELIKAVDNLDKAAKIFEDIGIKSASSKIVEVLASLK